MSCESRVTNQNPMTQVMALGLSQKFQFTEYLLIQVTVRRTADGKREFKFKKMSRDEIEDVTAKKIEKLLGYKYQTKASTL